MIQMIEGLDFIDTKNFYQKGLDTWLDSFQIQFVVSKGKFLLMGVHDEHFYLTYAEALDMMLFSLKIIDKPLR